MGLQEISRGAWEGRAQREAAKEFQRGKPRMLNKEAECDLAERRNSWDGRQAGKADQS